jgi:hypothetical protein
MPRIVLKEKITREINISLDTLCEAIDTLTKGERKSLLERLNAPPVKLKPFRKDKIEAIMVDFAKSSLYEEDFLRDLEEGLRKSSPYGK